MKFDTNYEKRPVPARIRPAIPKGLGLELGIAALMHSYSNVANRNHSQSLFCTLHTVFLFCLQVKCPCHLTSLVMLCGGEIGA